MTSTEFRIQPICPISASTRRAGTPLCRGLPLDVEEVTHPFLAGNTDRKPQVLMAIDVPAAGITADAISFACYAVGSAADHFDVGLHKQFGGKSMFRADG